MLHIISSIKIHPLVDLACDLLEQHLSLSRPTEQRSLVKQSLSGIFAQTQKRKGSAGNRSARWQILSQLRWVVPMGVSRSARCVTDVVRLSPGARALPERQQQPRLAAQRCAASRAVDSPSVSLRTWPRALRFETSAPLGSWGFQSRFESWNRLKLKFCNLENCLRAGS